MSKHEQQAPPRVEPTQAQAPRGLTRTERSEPDRLQIIDAQAIERRAATLTSRAVAYINKAPVAAKLLTGELILAWITHPHMSMIRGGLVALGASMAWDAWRRRHPAKPSSGLGEDQ